MIDNSMTTRIEALLRLLNVQVVAHGTYVASVGGFLDIPQASSVL